MGAFHIIYLLLSLRSVTIRIWYFMLPILVALCGFFILYLSDLHSRGSLVALLTGICLLLFNITSLQEYWAERRARRVVAVDTTSTHHPDSQDNLSISNQDYLPAVDTSQEDGDD